MPTPSSSTWRTRWRPRTSNGPAARSSPSWAPPATDPNWIPSRTIVRINPAGTEEFEKDLHCLAHTPYRTVMLAKAESAGQLKALEDFHVIALCETAAGVLNAPAIAAEPNVVALMWGAEDLLASLGGTSSRKDDGGYRAVALHARSSVLLAAGAFGKAAVDAVYVNIPDLEGLAVEAADAVASGFGSKACIHPTQAAVVRGRLRPVRGRRRPPPRSCCRPPPPPVQACSSTTAR